jgi:hypothetical protein
MRDGEHGRQRLSSARLIESHYATSSLRHAQASALGLRAVVYRRLRGRSSLKPKNEDTGADQMDPHPFLRRRTLVEKHNGKDGD